MMSEEGKGSDDRRAIIAVDLKSFYASAELASRSLDPLRVNLVVADPTRTEKTICLAVSPSLKAYGIPGRARLFEVVQKIREVNAQRLQEAVRLGRAGRDANGKPCFSGISTNADELAKDPSLEVSYIVAPPRMSMYEKISTQIFSIYMRYISDEDIHVYSIDECFMDVTAYLNTYKLSARELAMKMIREVLSETGITATAGIGTNLYLAKIAMDIVAKKMPADEQGVRIAELDERSYRELLWCHRPLTDFWRVGKGISKRLEKLQCRTMGDVARLSVWNEGLLYDEFGINAELLIDHAWGWEPTQISTIKQYRPEVKSISSGQVLTQPYDADKGRLIIREMTELLVLDLVRKNLVTKQITLNIGYDRESLRTEEQGGSKKNTVYIVSKTGERYTGDVISDTYGRAIPKYAHGTSHLEEYTSSTRKIVDAMVALYDRIIDPDLLIRRAYVIAEGVIRESDIPPKEPEQLDLFTDYEAKEKELREEKAAEDKERRMQKATLILQEKFGKNAVLKGMNLSEGATTITRNGQIGGHKAE